MNETPCPRGLLLALTLAACGDDGPAHPGGTGAVEVTAVSTGQGLDTDGCVVDVVGAGTLAIGTNATTTLAEVPAGDREVRLTGVRGNCTVQAPHPRLIRVVPGETLRTHFDVVCAHTPLLGRIVFYSNSDGTYNLYSMNPDGSDRVQLTDLPEEERGFYPAVSPDGSKVLFINRIGPYDDFNTAYLYVMNADGTNLVRLPPTDGGSLGPAVWSPDGSQIAFHGWIEDGGFEIWVMDADGTGLRNLTNTPDVGEGSPSWSPDGARIAFLTILNERSRIYTMGADGSDPAPLTPDDGGHDVTVSWSPAGDRLAYIHVVDPDVEVYVINADGTGAVNISDNDTFEYLGPQAWGP